MVTESHVRGWVDAYIEAWDTNQPDDITSLFTPDARYFTEPHAQPWEGHEEIVRGWLERRDAPGETSFEYRVIVTSQDLAIVKGEAATRAPARSTRICGRPASVRTAKPGNSSNGGWNSDLSGIRVRCDSETLR